MINLRPKHQTSIVTAMLLLLVIWSGCRPVPTDSVAASVTCEKTCTSTVPEIVFARTEYDFGKIAAGTKQSCTFDFINDGGKELVIKSIYASCGCTTTVAENTTLFPGEVSEIEVMYHAPFYGGKFKKRIVVYTNDPQNPQIDLWISAEVPSSPINTKTAISIPTSFDKSKEETMAPSLKQSLRNLNKATN